MSSDRDERLENAEWDYNDGPDDTVSDAEWTHNRHTTRQQSMLDRMKQKWRSKWRPKVGRTAVRTVLLAVLGSVLMAGPKLAGVSFVEVISQAVIALEPATRTQAIALAGALTMVGILSILAVWFACVWAGSAIIYHDVRDSRSLWQLIKSRPSVLLLMAGGFYVANAAAILAGGTILTLMTANVTIVEIIQTFAATIIFLYGLAWILGSIYEKIYEREESHKTDSSWRYA